MITFQQRIVRKIHPVSVFGEWWLSPMGGQARRIKKVIELLDEFKPMVIIETGTFIGSTTPLLATLFDVPVFTIEVQERLARRNQKTFSKLFPDLNITQLVGSSELEMKKILEIQPNSSKIFAYLDAHWFDYLPATDELNQLVNWGGEFIALIDDFQNIFDPGYGFDEYRSGQYIGSHLIPKDKGLRVYVPRISSKKEGLARRGTAYIFSKNLLIKYPNLDVSDLVEIKLN